EAVLEHDHVVVGGRDLGRPAVPGRAERALVGRWEVGPALAGGGDDHPLLGQGVAADLAGGDGRGQVAGLGGPTVDPLALVEVEQLAPVGQPDRGLDQLHHDGSIPGPRGGAGGKRHRGGKIPASRPSPEEAPSTARGSGACWRRWPWPGRCWPGARAAGGRGARSRWPWTTTSSPARSPGCRPGPGSGSPTGAGRPTTPWPPTGAGARPTGSRPTGWPAACWAGRACTASTAPSTPPPTATRAWPPPWWSATSPTT